MSGLFSCFAELLFLPLNKCFEAEMRLLSGCVHIRRQLIYCGKFVHG